MPVQFYSWEDAGAPQFVAGGYDSAAGKYKSNMMDIFDAVLVDGYGDKPPLGWSKVMQSEQPDSDRRVYQNVSAGSQNMRLIIQGNIHNQVGVTAQIADVVDSPEQYSGYSGIVSITKISNYQEVYWYFIGDERTFIFIFTSKRDLDSGQSNWDNYYPCIMYAGDVEFGDATNPKPWALIGPVMATGTIDNLSNSAHARVGVFDFDATHKPVLRGRPLTQIPNAEWNENKVICFYGAFASIIDSYLERLIYEVAEFEQKASIIAPYYGSVNGDVVFKMRGVVSIYPWLCHHTATTRTRNWLLPLSVNGEQYFGFCRNIASADDYNLPMPVYLQLTGEWA